VARQSLRIESPLATVPGSITFAFKPRKRRWRCVFVLTKRCASFPKREENLTQPVCGSGVTSMTAEPSASLVPAGRFVYEMSKSK
jgi:hypothetical protein